MLPLAPQLWRSRQHLLLVAAAARAVILVPVLVYSAFAGAPVWIMAVLAVLFGSTNG